MSEDKDPPGRLKLVAKNDDPTAFFKINEVAADVQACIDKLVPNLLRSLARAGEPWRVAADIVTTSQAILALDALTTNVHRATANIAVTLVAEAMRAALPGFDEHVANFSATPETAKVERWRQDGTEDRWDAQNEILRQALRVIASRLAGRMT